MTARIERVLFGSVLYPAYQTLQGGEVLRLIEACEKEQWYSRARIDELQAEKLVQLLQHAAEKVPYYQQLLAGIQCSKGPEALRQMPPLTKADIRSAEGMLQASDANPRDLEPNSTSGSTGEPLRFYTDRRSSNGRKAAVVRNRRWAGVQPGDREMRLWGSPIDNDKAKALRGRLHSWLTRTRMINAYDLSRDALQSYLREIAAYKPSLLISYPSVLEELAGEAVRSGFAAVPIGAIVVSAERLFPAQRELFQNVFASQVFNRYGCREVGDIAHECNLHQGLHLNSERVFVEVVREDLSPCAPGEIGDLLVTDLDNYGMPLIRYSIGDRGAFAEAPCACGRGLPLLGEIEGRSLDVVRFPNGSAVGGTYWTILLRERPGIRQFQVIQQHIDEVIIHYTADINLSLETEKFIQQDVRRRAGPDFRVVFDHVEEIKRTAAGKRRLVISQL